MQKVLREHNWLVGLLYFVVVLGVFFAFVATVPSGLADSDELLTVSFLGGAAHPPGYPVLVSVTHAAMHLISFVDPAVVGNGLSALFQAGGIACALYAFWRLVQREDSIPLSEGLLLGVLSSVWTATSLNLFLLGTRMEVGALNTLLLGLLFFLVVDWWLRVSAAKTVPYSFYAAFLVAGLGVAHLQSFVLLFPGLLIVLVRGLRQSNQKEQYKEVWLWLKGVGLFFLGIGVSLALLYWLNSRAQPVSWFFDPGFSGLWKQVTRQDYAGFFVDEGRTRQAYWAGLGAKLFTSQPVYFRLLYENFSLLGIVLGIIGLFFLYVKQRWWFFAGVFWYGLTGPFLAGYLGMPTFTPDNLEYNLLIAVVQRQFVMSDLIWGGFIFLGIWYLYSQLSVRALAYRAGFLLLLFMGLGLMGYDNAKIVQNQNTPYIQDYAHTMLQAAPEQSVIICSSDIACFSLLYAQYVQGRGEQTTVLTKNNVYRRYFIASNPEFFPFLYEQNPYFFSNLVAWNRHRSRVFLTNPDSFYIDYIGLDGEPFFLVPHEYLFEVVAAIPEEVPRDVSTEVAVDLLGLPRYENDYWTHGFSDYVANIHQFAGVLQLFLGNERSANTQLETALTLKPNYERARSWLIQMNSPEAVEEFDSGPLVSADTLLSRGREQIEAGDYENAHELLLKTSFLEPEAILPRLQLAELYQSAGYADLAAREWQHVLRFDPENETAREGLKKQVGLPVE